MPILQNEADRGKGDDVARPVEITAEDCYSELSVKGTKGIQGIVTNGPGDKPNDHKWNLGGAVQGLWMAEKSANKRPAYMIMAAFDPGSVARWRGRSCANVVALQGFWIDVEGSLEKGGYDGAQAVSTAVKAFRLQTGLLPTHVIFTGSGGVHLHYVISETISLEVWAPRAKALVALCVEYGFKIDAQCTTDAARFMRAPGSIHQKTDKVVTAYRWKSQPYTLDEFDALIGYDSAPTPQVLPTQTRKWDASINSDVSPDYPAYSYKKAAEKCGAMRMAALWNGRDTPYPVWILALRTAALSVEGREYAHEISCGHGEYDAAETDRKLGSLTGGPASCKTWADAWGSAGPCESCEQWRAQ